jgi:hypothetical protein
MSTKMLSIKSIADFGHYKEIDEGLIVRYSVAEP